MPVSPIGSGSVKMSCGVSTSFAQRDEHGPGNVYCVGLCTDDSSMKEQIVSCFYTKSMKTGLRALLCSLVLGIVYSARVCMQYAGR